MARVIALLLARRSDTNQVDQVTTNCGSHHTSGIPTIVANIYNMEADAVFLD